MTRASLRTLALLTAGALLALSAGAASATGAHPNFGTQPTHALTGRIVDDAGRPVAGATVSLWQDGPFGYAGTRNPGYALGPTTTTASDGSYDLGVPYGVAFVVDAYDAHHSTVQYGGATTYAYDPSDANNEAMLRIDQDTTLPDIALHGDGTHLTPLTVYSPAYTTGYPGVGDTLQAAAPTAAPASYIASAQLGDLTLAYAWLRDGKQIPGATDDSYTLTSADAGHAIRARVTVGGTHFADSTSTSLPVTATTKPDPHHYYTVSGTVTDADGNPLRDASVLVYSLAKPSNGRWTDLRVLVGTVTAPDGTFSVGGVPDGTTVGVEAREPNYEPEAYRVNGPIALQGSGFRISHDTKLGSLALHRLG